MYPHVALLIETSREYARGILRGIARYNREHGPWSIYLKQQDLGDAPPSWLKSWHGNGILARINDRRMANAVRATGLPAIDLRGAVDDVDIPLVGVDNKSVALMAFEHLQERGFRHFAYCGFPRGVNRFENQRCDFFRQRAEEAGYPVHVYQSPRGQRSVEWEREQSYIASWIQRLPKPVGVLACHDDRGQQVLDACRRIATPVPDEVAVVGVDNDECLCSLAAPPLTSVDVNAENIGFEAASLLSKMMQGKKLAFTYRMLPARGIVARQSTDVLAIEDPEVVEAVRYIRTQATRGISVSDVLDRVPLSHSMLNRRFNKLLGHSPKTEITRAQLQAAKELLINTELSIAAIAVRCGFNDPNYFFEVFRRKVGMTPRSFRRQG